VKGRGRGKKGIKESGEGKKVDIAWPDL